MNKINKTGKGDISAGTNRVAERGFTLMELLLTLFIFSAIMGILLTTFMQFHQQSKRMESITRLRREARILERIIRFDIQSVIYLDQFMTEAKDQPDFRKSGVYGVDETLGTEDADKLHMHVNATSKFQRAINVESDPGLHEVSYYLEEENDRVLFRRREEYYVDANIEEGDRSIVHTLSYNVSSFNVQYYKGTETEPLDEWDSGSYKQSKNDDDKLPTGMLVSLVFTGKDNEEYKMDLQINIRPYMGNGVDWR